MNQMQTTISLLDLTEGNDHPFGNTKGREVHSKLMDIVHSRPSIYVFEIALNGIVATDASFPRESIISVAKQLRGEKWFYLTGFDSQDLIDNWNYAASAKEQPLMVWNNKSYELIGSKLKGSGIDLLNCVIESDSATTSSIAKKLDISVQNASTRLKKLVSDGLIMRLEDTADSGGIEFIYRAIKDSG